MKTIEEIKAAASEFTPGRTVTIKGLVSTSAGTKSDVSVTIETPESYRALQAESLKILKEHAATGESITGDIKTALDQMIASREKPAEEGSARRMPNYEALSEGTSLCTLEGNDASLYLLRLKSTSKPQQRTAKGAVPAAKAFIEFLLDLPAARYVRIVKFVDGGFDSMTVE